MRAYPDGHTGDSLMALWFAYSEFRDRSGNRLVIPESFMQPVAETPNLKDPHAFKAEERKADDAIRQEQEYERSNYNRIMSRYLHK
jgi:hypothetical protein